MTTLTEFLLARIAEDEQAARDASPSPWQYGDIASVAGGTIYDESRRIADVTYEQANDHDGSVVRHLLSDEADANGRHIARHDPARVLRECEAKREIVAHYEAYAREADRNPDVFALVKMSEAVEGTLVELARVFRDHPDYREEWR
jgi:hypothetical protein